MLSRVSAVIPALAIAVIVTFIIVVILGSGHSARGPSHAALPSETPASPPTGHAPALSLECIAERIRHAPAPFHWSYKRNTASIGSAKWEADVSPNLIEGKLVDSSGTFPIHAVRADSPAWNTAVSALTAPLPESAFALLQDLPAPVPAAVERLGSEYTIKYRIDISRGTPADAPSIRKALGPNGFVNGAVWVNRDGCPVKFVLDVGRQLGEGSVKKVHYEGDATEQMNR